MRPFAAPTRELPHCIGVSHAWLVTTSADGPHGQAGHEPDEEYLAERERIGWQSVALIVGTIVVVLSILTIALAVLRSNR